MNNATYQVGEIVIVHGYDRTEGCKGFIEEIISDHHPDREGIIWQGKYSVYGLETAHDDSREKREMDIYFGDYRHKDIESLGEFMTKQSLESWASNYPNNKGIQRDVKKVIANLRRASGRNE